AAAARVPEASEFRRVARAVSYHGPWRVPARRRRSMAGVRIGLIGYGAWGKHHARAIRETRLCELVAVCARTEEARRLAAAETGAAVHADYRQLLARTDVDAVDIVAPNYLHEEVACAALEAGKHVLLEKPMATSVEACDRILAAASRARRLLLVGHEMRF